MGLKQRFMVAIHKNADDFFGDLRNISPYVPKPPGAKKTE
jgi:hypothetical protein